MSASSDIEWTDATWNPTRGCRKISSGCKNCYAETFAERFKGVAGHPYELGFAPRTAPDKLLEPLKWKKPKRIFVNSMSDLFLEEFDDTYIDEVMAVMLLCPQHTFQVLTKRAERMAHYLRGHRLYDRVLAAANRIRDGRPELTQVGISDPALRPAKWIWFGVSVEDQERAEQRIPHLLKTPAAVRFLSCEPLLGPLDLSRWLLDPCNCMVPYQEGAGQHHPGCDTFKIPWGLDWIIVGGESGHGARPFELTWARSIVEQCKGAGTACFVKQVGSNPRLAGDHGFDLSVMRKKKGGDMQEWPLDLRVRQFPIRGDER